MSAATICILVTIALYLVMMVTIGAVFSKKNKNSGDFFLGGRKLGPLVTAMSAEASDMSSWLLMGLPGLALMTGIAEASWTAIGLAIGIPNFFSAKFLLGALQDIAAVIVYPVYSVATILTVTLAGILFFREKLENRQWLALAMILPALVLLNI